MTDDVSGKAKGGKARAAKLSAEERKEIAQKAATARWQSGADIPRAKYPGVVKIGDTEIPCAVLDDGTRVLTQEGFFKAIGRSGKPAAGRGSSVEKIAPFLALDNLKPFIDEELVSSTKPIMFIPVKGSKAYGYKAELLPRVCEVYLKARDEKALLRTQLKFAKACDILVRGLAHVGIIALVDEATGYQDVRDRQALQAILDRFLRKEHAAWARRFPIEFYQEIFRLRGWEWKGLKVNPPQIVARYTNDVVYSRLTPGLLEELEKKNPKNERGYRRAKHHQWLTEDVGHPALAQHLYAVIGLMRIAEDKGWDQFKAMLDKAYPRYTKLKDLPLFNDLSLPSARERLS